MYAYYCCNHVELCRPDRFNVNKSEELNRIGLCLSCDLNVLFSTQLKMLFATIFISFLNPFHFFCSTRLKARTFTDNVL